MEIVDERNSSTTTLDFSGSVVELLKRLCINPETVLVVRNDEVLTEDIDVRNTDTITILSVISGG